MIRKPELNNMAKGGGKAIGVRLYEGLGKEVEVDVLVKARHATTPIWQRVPSSRKWPNASEGQMGQKYAVGEAFHRADRSGL